MKTANGSIDCYGYVYNGVRGLKPSFKFDGIRRTEDILNFDKMDEFNGNNCVISVYIYDKKTYRYIQIASFLADGISEDVLSEVAKIKKAYKN